MKKALAILTALAVVGGAAFAEISVGGWGRAVFVPLANSGAEDVDSTSHLGTSWTNGAPRIGFTVAGNSDNVGFQIDMNADNVFGTTKVANNDVTGDPVDVNFVGFGDQAKIWVKPVDMVTLTVGRFKEDTLRGNGTFGVFDWYRPYGTWTGEDLTFTRIESNNGLVVTATPVEGLFAAFALKELDIVTEDLAKNMQLAAGYTIADVGQIRAQYLTTYSAALDENYGLMEVAFKLSAVENLYADFGFAMGMGDSAANMNISAYGNYNVAGATVHALADVTIFEADDVDPAMELGVGANYGLSNGIGLVGDVRYMNTDPDATITFFAGATKGFSNGVFGAGVEVKSAADMGYAIPVRFEYWF